MIFKQWRNMKENKEGEVVKKALQRLSQTAQKCGVTQAELESLATTGWERLNQAPIRASNAGKNLRKALNDIQAETCQHDFFECQVPAGDSCVAIYHKVCKLCRWDKTKGIFMPDEIWDKFARRQLKELNDIQTEAETD